MRPAQQIGTLIKTLRKQRGFTSQQLGDLAELSQSKISKIENGYPPLDKPAIERVLNILDAPKTIRQQIDLLFAKHGHLHTIGTGQAFKPSTEPIIEIEKRAKQIRVYTSNRVTSLAQTLEYRMGILKRLNLSADDTQQKLHEVSLRQDMLWDAAKQYHFIIHEAGLYTLVTNVEAHLAQLDRLERLTTLQRFKIGIVPLEMGLLATCQNNFVVYDDELVINEFNHYEPGSHDPEIILLHLQAFNELDAKSFYGEEARSIIRKASDYFSITPSSTQAMPAHRHLRSDS